MKRCVQCGQPYDRDGGPMIPVCSECLNKPAPSPAFVEKNGLLIPNKD